MISVIDGVNERVLRIMLLKNGKEVSSLSWINKKVQVGKDQEKAQSEKDSHSKNRGGKKPK